MRLNKDMRILAFFCIFGLSAQELTIKTSVPLILVPTSVTDRRGKGIGGLTEKDFEVFDNGKLVKHSLEISQLPIALVVAVQTSSIAGPALAKVQKIGAMFEPLVVGDRGVLALLTYSDKVTVMQEFTSDGKLFSATMRRLEPDGGGAKLNDAVLEAVKLLEDRQKYRRVVVVIGESKDRGSSAKLEQAVTKAQAANVTIYPVTYSAYATPFTSKGDERFESGRRVYDSGSGLNLLAIFSEIGRMGDKNSADAFAKYTGGERLSFTKLAGLEKVITKVGDDLHTQYLLSFSPQESSAPVYHQISLKVKAGGAVVRARPGYWAE